MFEFKILKKSKKSGARIGVLRTSHGEVETPCLVPVATQAVVKTLTSEEVLETNSQVLICNTYHLHLRPGEKTVKKFGGLHKFMNWPKSLMTDSGGFQVFSLGFGSDLGMGKILKNNAKLRIYANAAKTNKEELIKLGQQPKLLKITNDGVWFNSPIDGGKIFLGPKESIRIQHLLGADIIFTFDECTPPLADYLYTKKSLIKTHKWAKICLAEKTYLKSRQALYGIVQGGRFKDLRRESARFIGSLPFEGFGIGGEFGDNKKDMSKMIGWVIKELPEEKPRHLLGIGYPEDMKIIIERGIDTFDCTVPTHYARHGVAFTSGGKLNMLKSTFLKDKKSLDKNCPCKVCQNYSRSYISHLLKAKEITALRILTFHNLFFFNTLIKKIRKDIKNGKL